MYHRTGVIYKAYWAYSRMTTGGVYIMYLLLITIFGPLSELQAVFNFFFFYCVYYDSKLLTISEYC